MKLSIEGHGRKVEIITEHDELDMNEILDELERLLCAYGYAHYKLDFELARTVEDECE